jgi:Zn-dependent peptidase ImmA (M78 family)
MRLLADRLSKLQIGWNERPLNEDDFLALCGCFDITVDEQQLGVGGFYYRVMGRDFIAVDSRLRWPEKLGVLFHELGHFLLHAPRTGAAAGFHRVGRSTRKEREADVFALCALIPRAWVESRAACDLIDEGFRPEMVAARFAIYEQYGI